MGLAAYGPTFCPLRAVFLANVAVVGGKASTTRSSMVPSDIVHTEKNGEQKLLWCQYWICMAQKKRLDGKKAFWG